MQLFSRALSILAAFALVASAVAADLDAGFASPPDSARPWVYWFWSDGTLSREGVTADLEAMRRAGIRGVIIMEVNQGTAPGPVEFMSPAWREMWKHVGAEAHRLGIDIDMNAGPGWSGSGGPWMKPEDSMQQVVWSATEVAGPASLAITLAQPTTRHDYYRDLAVLAFPTPEGNAKIARTAEKALYRRGYFSSQPFNAQIIPMPADYPEPSAGEVIPEARLLNLSKRMDQAGLLTWEVPEGRWTIFRFGFTTTGALTKPAPKPGLGLECDKFSKAALDAHYDEFIGPLMADMEPDSPLVSWHIDSWEVGPQNWSPVFRDEFMARRGYDPIPWLPTFSGQIVGSLERSERFLWDLRETSSELVRDNYAGHLRDRVAEHGMRLSIEPYDGTPCDDMSYGARADVPMCEFWSDQFDTTFSCAEASSIAHVYGKRIVAAEAFTAGSQNAWRFHPATMKALGDWAFCEGVNRFVVHRYSMQPWLDRVPGMTMGPWGTHYERTQTWWEMSTGWHDYVARCQYLLQQGLFVADLCYLMPEGSPATFVSPLVKRRFEPMDRPGYNFDGCTPEALLSRVSVRDGRLVLPDGMSYRLLVLPSIETMTPRLLGKVRDLVAAGATVVGSPVKASPSLVGFPACDEQVKTLAAQLWGDDLSTETRHERKLGKGRILWGGALTPEQPTALSLPPGTRWIWKNEGNPAAAAPVGRRWFQRVVTLPAGEIEYATCMLTADNAFALSVNGTYAGRADEWSQIHAIDVAGRLHAGENTLLVEAYNGSNRPNPAGFIGALLWKMRGAPEETLVTDKAWQASTVADGSWEAARELGPANMAPWSDLTSTVKPPTLFPGYAALASLLGETNVPPDFESDVRLRYIHRRDGDTDIYFVANPSDTTVVAQCTFRTAGRAPELWDPMTGRIAPHRIYRQADGRTTLPLQLPPTGSVFVIFRSRATGSPVASVTRNGRDLLASAQLRGDVLLANLPGDYEVTNAEGKKSRTTVKLPPPVEVSGPWEVQFQPGRKAPERATFDQLIDWTSSENPGVRYFSGTATYRATFSAPAVAEHRVMELDLGRVEVMARVKLNGKELGILWKTPYRVDVTDALKAGENTLEIEVANLWPNRMIGDAALPEDERITWASWNPFKPESELAPSGLLGPVDIRTLAVVPLDRK